MARYVTSVETPLPVTEAFSYLADMTNFASWDPGVTRATRITGDGISVGSAYDLTVKAGGTTVMRYVVDEVEVPHRIVWVARTAFLTSVDEVRVKPSSVGSVVTYDAKLTFNGPLGVFDPVLRVAFGHIGDRAAAGLRRALRGTAVKA